MLGVTEVTRSPPSARPAMLATDLDGTLIPLDDNPQNSRDLEHLVQELKRAEMSLAFVTGRHWELVQEAMEQHALPQPNWLICDVGTSVYESAVTDSDFESGAKLDGLTPMSAYAQHLEGIVGDYDVDRLAELLSSVAGIRKQEPEKQGRFKLSYYSHQCELDRVVDELEVLLGRSQAPYGIIASVDPFTEDGLIDLLPRGVSKSHALDWLVRHAGLQRQQVLFAGDSGNDLAALTAGYHSIIVGNAAETVVTEARRAHRAAGWSGRLYTADHPATSGVLEGLRHFLTR